MRFTNHAATWPISRAPCIVASLLHIFMCALAANDSVASVPGTTVGSGFQPLQPIHQGPVVDYYPSEYSFISGRVYVEQIIDQFQSDSDAQKYVRVGRGLHLEANDSSHSERLPLGHFEPLPFGPDSLRLTIINGVLFAEQRLSVSNDGNGFNVFAANFGHFLAGRIAINHQVFCAIREHDALIVQINLSQPIPEFRPSLVSHDRPINAHFKLQIPLLVPDGCGSCIMVCELLHNKDRIKIVDKYPVPISTMVFYSADMVMIKSAKVFEKIRRSDISASPMVLFNLNVSLTTVLFLSKYRHTILNNCTIRRLDTPKNTLDLDRSKTTFFNCIFYLMGHVVPLSTLIEVERRRCEQKKNKALKDIEERLKSKMERRLESKMERHKRKGQLCIQRPILPKPLGSHFCSSRTTQNPENPAKRTRIENA